MRNSFIRRNASKFFAAATVLAMALFTSPDAHAQFSNILPKLKAPSSPSNQSFPMFQQFAQQPSQSQMPQLPQLGSGQQLPQSQMPQLPQLGSQQPPQVQMPQLPSIDPQQITSQIQACLDNALPAPEEVAEVLRQSCANSEGSNVSDECSAAIQELQQRLQSVETCVQDLVSGLNPPR